MGVEGVARAGPVEVDLHAVERRHLLEVVLGTARLVDQHAVLVGDVLGRRALSMRRRARVELEAAEHHLDLVAVGEAFERGQEALAADGAPGTHHIGPDLDEHCDVPLGADGTTQVNACGGLAIPCPVSRTFRESFSEADENE